MILSFWNLKKNKNNKNQNKRKTHGYREQIKRGMGVGRRVKVGFYVW